MKAVKKNSSGPPCRICHYRIKSSINGHNSYCVYWGWVIYDEEEKDGISRKHCKSAYVRSKNDRDDPYISSMGPSVDPVALAERNWAIKDYRANVKRSNIALVISILGLSVSVIALMVSMW
ncbi:hypothetical protein [Magnetofaba australis]|uniref:hypothetical protein n=1 Tax=Magnetofaba australis TaxID=1472297 RepID=UPI00117E0EE9|nr:hypothetical protein [Magnetofaba australis]